MRQDRKIPGRRRRRRGPFERAAVPGIAGQRGAARGRGSTQRAARSGRRSRQNDDGADHRDQQPGLPSQIVVMLHAPGHAHQAQHVERHEGEMEADEPAPERGFAPAFVEREAECLGEPVIVAGHRAEHDAADDDVMEVRDQEHAVVQLEIDRRHGQQHAGHAADDEGHHEADGPQHRHRESNAAAVHREQPVEDFHARRHRDDHAHDAEEGVDVRAGAHGEKVVQPDRERRERRSPWSRPPSSGSRTAACRRRSRSTSEKMPNAGRTRM